MEKVLKQRGGQKERMTPKREGKKGRVGVGDDGEREETETKQMGRSGTRGKLSVALCFRVREFTFSR